MDHVARMSAERACTRLSVAYANAVDLRDYDRFVELFAADAVLQLTVLLEKLIDGHGAARMADR